MQNQAKKIVKIGALSILFLLIAIFVFFNSRNIIFGIKIRNVNIVDNQKFTGSILKITGNAKNALFISLNDREISVDQKGNFEETIALLPGYNVIEISAKDKFGNSDEKNYKVIYDASETPAQ